MASSSDATKLMFVYALILPVAALLGYLLADPSQPTSILMVILAIGALSIPLLMSWYHPLLICCWNAAITPFFLPGQPYLWMLMAFIGLIFGVVNRFTNADAKFVSIPSVSRSLLVLLLVVLVTAYMRGGVGLRSFGSARIGGKHYFFLVAAIVGFFAMLSQRVPPHRARMYTGLFFLAGLTALVPNLAYLGGSYMEFLFYLFPPGYAMEQAMGDYSLSIQFARVYGLTIASPALFCWLMVRYGIRGVLDWSYPWRLALLLLACVGALYCGFRSVLIFLGMIFAIQFYLEGLFRPRNLFILASVMVVVGSLMLPNAEKLPLVVQRTISFLPVEISPIARQNADYSAQWRLQMWEQLLPTIPEYLWKGKGYGIDPTDLEFAFENARRGYMGPYGGSLAAGDYHSGPLTIIIPLGIWGVLAFAWFIIVSLRYLYRAYRYGAPEFIAINRFLLAFFIARVVSFVFIFGSFSNELYFFTGIIGLSVSLNGAEATERVAQEEQTEELGLGELATDRPR